MTIKKRQRLFNELKKAFTLIEVIVAIFIFLIILSIVMINYGYSQRVDELKLSVFDVEDSIRFTQNMALTGQKIQNSIPKRYGIYFTKYNVSSFSEGDTYIIYGNVDDDGYDTSDYIYSESNLPRNIKFTELKCDILNESGGTETRDFNTFDISFLAPRAYMKINAFSGGVFTQNDDIRECYIRIKNITMDGYWVISITPASSKLETKFYKP